MCSAGSLLAQTSYETNYSTSASASGGIGALVPLLILVLVIVGLWKVFTKAGEPGWAAIIPIYNTYILLKIVGKPWWWLLLLCIPIVNFVIAIIVMFELRKAFCKVLDLEYLILLSFVFIPILGFGSATIKAAKA